MLAEASQNRSRLGTWEGLLQRQAGDGAHDDLEAEDEQRFPRRTNLAGKTEIRRVVVLSGSPPSPRRNHDLRQATVVGSSRHFAVDLFKDRRARRNTDVAHLDAHAGLDIGRIRCRLVGAGG